jgi:sugar phosphate isomerase/epimerase
MADENRTMMTRRTMFGVMVGEVAASAAGQQRLRLGGQVFLKTDDPEEIAREYRRLGFSAAYCPNMKPTDTDRIAGVRNAFASQDVVIAELGIWRYNMLARNLEERKAAIGAIADALAVADGVAARCCLTITGTYSAQQHGPDPRNYSREAFDATVENCRKVIDAVKPRNTKFAIEMLSWGLPDGPDPYLRLLKAVDRPAFGVHVDLCNIINTNQRFFANADLIEETFRKLGGWVCSCHMKDLVGRNVHYIETVPGRGEIDYRAYVRTIAKYSPNAPMMIEHLSSPDEYEEGKQYILKIGRELGMSFA